MFDIFDSKRKKTISYQKRGNKEIYVKIACDLKMAIMSNGKEHYLHNGTNQQNIPWLKDKYIRYAIDEEAGFFLVTSKDYDRDIDILSTSDEDFNASIDRSSEPDHLKIYDSLTFEEDGKSYLNTLSLIGDQLFSDTIDKSMCKDDDPTSAVLNTSSE